MAKNSVNKAVVKDGKEVRIVIVDDHPIVRQGLKELIERDKDILVCGDAGDTKGAIRVIAKHEPDLALVDISLNGTSSGIDLIRAIRDRFPAIKTLVLSMHDELTFAERAIRAGAGGYIMKKEATRNIIQAIRKVMQGGIYLSEEMSGRIINKLLHANPDAVDMTIEKLSNKQLDVFQLIGKGFKTGEIAKKLNISANTVESHRRHIKEKLGLNNSAELTHHAVQWSLTSDAE
jgi:DNA-binding NarL/FixJ family response regulator